MKAELKQKIDDEGDWLIQDGKRLADDTRIYLRIEDRNPKEVEEAQIRNLLDMATASDSVESIKLFIQYQVGREKLPKDFGDELIQRINNELKKKAKEISHERPDFEKDTYLRLVRQYLGYMNRYFMYKKKTAEGRK